MILNLVYSIVSIIYLSKTSPKLFPMLNKNIKNTKKEIKEKKKNNIYQTLTILFGVFGVHNIYEKKYTLGVIKLVIMINYIIYLYFINLYENEHEKEFDNFIENKKLSDVEKKLINKKIIKYTVKDGENEYKYYLTHNTKDYIKNKNPHFIYYSTITSIFFFFNMLQWFIDVINIM